MVRLLPLRLLLFSPEKSAERVAQVFSGRQDGLAAGGRLASQAAGDAREIGHEDRIGGRALNSKWNSPALLRAAGERGKGCQRSQRTCGISQFGGHFEVQLLFGTDRAVTAQAADARHNQAEIISANP